MSERTTGTVKWFNVTKGYGMITRDGGPDIPVHHSSIPDGQPLEEGQRVDFTVEKGPMSLLASNVIARHVP